MHTTLLILHIVGAVMTAIAAFGAVFVLYRQLETKYRASVFTLAFFVVFQLTSGTVLYLLSPDMSIFVLCRNFALYLTIPITLEVILFMKIKRRAKSQIYPVVSEVSR